MKKILDALAIMSWVEKEPAGPAVGRLLRQTAAGRLELLMNMINVGEVYYQMFDLVETALPVPTLVPDRQFIIEAAGFTTRRQTQPLLAVAARNPILRMR